MHRAPWEYLDDEDFFRALDSEAYRRRFGGHCHPILKENGGLDFHNPETLGRRLDELKQALAVSRPGRNRWFYSNVIRVTESWLQQSRWIIDRLERGML
jgi:hypothetical protein